LSLKVVKEAALKGHANPIFSLCKGYDEHIIFSGGADAVVAAWNLKAFKSENFSIKFEQPIYSLHYDETNGVLYAGNSLGGIHVIDLNLKKEIKLLQNHQKAIFDLKIINNTLVACSADGHVSFTHLENLIAFKIVKLCQQKVRQIAVDKELNKIYFACGDCSIKIFDAINFSAEKIIGAHDLSCNAIAISPNNGSIISGGRDAFFNVFDSDYQLTKSIAAHNFAVYSFDFSPNKKWMASGSRDKTIKIWNAENYEILLRIDRLKGGHKNSVNKVFWSNFNDYLLSTGDDGQILVWTVKED
jgi:WD repeat-containing protein 61